MLLGITGTLGAGKTTVAEYLQAKGFVYRSVRSYIIEEIHRRNIEVTRDTLVDVGNQLRAEHGPDFIMSSLIKEASQSGEHCVIESIRAVAEAELLLNSGGYLIAVDADQRLRYERLIESGSQVIPVSYEQFKEQEAREMHSTDDTKQSIADVVFKAQFYVTNTDTKEELHKEIDKIIETIKQITSPS